MAIILGYDPNTLREEVDQAAVAERLAEIADLRSAPALGERVSLLRLLGRLDDASALANEAVRTTRMSGDREQLLLARLRHAQVLQAQGILQPAIIELTECINEANSRGWDSIEAFGLQHRGKVYFEQGEFEPARRDFADALTLRIRLQSPPDQIDSTMFAISVAEARLAGE